MDPEGIFSVAQITAMMRLFGLSNAMARMVPIIAAAPAMSYFIFSIPSAGFMEMPPVSKVTPFPTKPSSHEGAGIVVDVGAGVTTVKKGDHVIPLYIPECRNCPSCLSRKTNLCTAIRTTQGLGVMPDGTIAVFARGQDNPPLYGLFDLLEFHRAAGNRGGQNPCRRAVDKACYIGCGVTTGMGAVINTAKVEPGAKAIVFGLGGIGLNVIQGLRLFGSNAPVLQTLDVPIKQFPNAVGTLLTGIRGNLITGFIDNRNGSNLGVVYRSEHRRLDAD